MGATLEIQRAQQMEALEAQMIRAQTRQVRGDTFDYLQAYGFQRLQNNLYVLSGIIKTVNCLQTAECLKTIFRLQAAARQRQMRHQVGQGFAERLVDDGWHQRVRQGEQRESSIRQAGILAIKQVSLKGKQQSCEGELHLNPRK